MANPTMTLIASNTVGSGGVSNVTFASIPSTYTDLVVKISARTSYSNVFDTLGVLFNSSSTGFTYKELYGNGSSAGSAANTVNICGYCNGATATSNTFANTEIYIPNYLSSNYKSYSTDSVIENNATSVLTIIDALLWSNTAAISSINISSFTSSTIQQYSTFYLYGIKNS
jgi:hypothetical protein